MDNFNINNLQAENEIDIGNLQLDYGFENNYNNITNKPKINNVELIGNKSLSDLGIDQNFVKDVNYVHTDNNYTTEDKTKLAGIETEATKTIINNTTTSASTTEALSANMGKELQEEIDNLKARGRFLALWNASTGLAQSDPTTSPYTYKAGDYFIVGIVGATNYKPTGTQYVIGTASTTVETSSLSVDDVYYFDGSAWRLQINTQKTVSFANIAGQPTDNSNLASVLNSKVSVEQGKGLSTNDYTRAEKTKLSGIEVNANNYILPVANTTTLGGIKPDGSTITVDTNGVASASGGSSNTIVLTSSPVAGNIDVELNTNDKTAMSDYAKSIGFDGNLEKLKDIQFYVQNDNYILKPFHITLASGSGNTYVINFYCKYSAMSNYIIGVNDDTMHNKICNISIWLYQSDLSPYIVSYPQRLKTNVDVGYLAKTNTVSFTPTSDYHPATKKYVDDSIASAITTSLGGNY